MYLPTWLVKKKETWKYIFKESIGWYIEWPHELVPTPDDTTNKKFSKHNFLILSNRHIITASPWTWYLSSLNYGCINVQNKANSNGLLQWLCQFGQTYCFLEILIWPICNVLFRFDITLSSQLSTKVHCILYWWFPLFVF